MSWKLHHNINVIENMHNVVEIISYYNVMKNMM